MSDRHPKWTPVEPGYVIPAGQPHRVERKNCVSIASEYIFDEPTEVRNYLATDDVFVDSSWKPPLDLPTEPTWGIAVTEYGGSTRLAQWSGNGESIWVPRERYGRPGLRDFIPLTDEQVQRIEAAR